ncbi:hypothetical protein GCM10008170_35330 [Methylopila capsulata]|uniref:Uncharacterized protein n=1 Tax=Methylopila capsulata TaxID=61654 RepID=A0A9W6IVY4_9HYPH|nr:hypothetical protein GCM10008170_35330 [Methylopila capsulata]
MTIFTIEQAEVELEALIEMVEAGRRVLIVGTSGRLVELQPIPPDENSRGEQIYDA